MAASTTNVLTFCSAVTAARGSLVSRSRPAGGHLAIAPPSPKVALAPTDMPGTALLTWLPGPDHRWASASGHPRSSESAIAASLALPEPLGSRRCLASVRRFAHAASSGWHRYDSDRDPRMAADRDRQTTGWRRPAVLTHRSTGRVKAQSMVWAASLVGSRRQRPSGRPEAHASARSCTHSQVPASKAPTRPDGWQLDAAVSARYECRPWHAKGVIRRAPVVSLLLYPSTTSLLCAGCWERPFVRPTGCDSPTWLRTMDPKTATATRQAIAAELSRSPAHQVAGRSRAVAVPELKPPCRQRWPPHCRGTAGDRLDRRRFVSQGTKGKLCRGKAKADPFWPQLEEEIVSSFVQHAHAHPGSRFCPVVVSLADRDQLAQTLREHGVDTLLSCIFTFGDDFEAVEETLMQAAIAAGVRRYAPSNYSIPVSQ